MASRTLLWLFCAAVAAAQQPAAIRGRTVNSITGQPLRRVHIRLLPPQNNIFEGSTSWGALSDDEGRFSIASIPPGTYLVQAMLPGYFYLPKTKAVPGLTVKAGDRIEDLRLELSPRAILSGRVVTLDGEPVEHATITREPATEGDLALSLALQMEGHPWFSPRNANGEFRIAVPPGKYHLRVQRDSVDAIGTDGLMTSLAYGDTYYPGVTDEKLAGVVEAVAGREVSGLEIRLGASKPMSISGTVAGVPAGARAEVKVICRNCGDRPSHPVAPDGTFLATDLMPDTYFVWAQCNSGGEMLRSATMSLELAGAPAAGIGLQLYPLGKLSGTVQLTQGLSGAGNTPRAVRLQPVEGGFFQRRERSLSGAVSQGGEFTIDAVAPDLYWLMVAPMPEDGYIQSVLPDAPLHVWAPTYRFSTDGAVADIMAPLDLRQGASGTRLKIVVAPGASISGKLIREGGVVDHDLAVLTLAPEGKTDPDDMLRASVNKRGEYVFHGLPPGVYRLIGFDAMENDSGAEPSFDKLLQKARRIELKAGEHVVIDLDLSNKGGGDEKH
jgi:hypothetical protein